MNFNSYSNGQSEISKSRSQNNEVDCCSESEALISATTAYGILVVYWMKIEACLTHIKLNI